MWSGRGDDHQEAETENFDNSCLGRIVAGTGKCGGGRGHEVLSVIWYVTLHVPFCDKSFGMLRIRTQVKINMKQLKWVECKNWIL